MSAMRLWLVLSACCVLAALGSGLARAVPAADLTNVRVNELIFTTQVLTQEGFIRVPAPDAFRFVVMRVTADRPTAEETRVFAHDFILSYMVADDTGQMHEERAGMEAISGDPGIPGDFGNFSHGTEPRVMLSGQRIEFGLVALIENSVQQAQLLRVGTPERTPLTLPERRFSVYASTTRGMGIAQQVAGALQTAGYQATPSAGLQGHTGVLLRYGQHAEQAAREVQALLHQQFGWNVTLEELDEETMLCEYDMLLWIGD